MADQETETAADEPQASEANDGAALQAGPGESERQNTWREKIASATVNTAIELQDAVDKRKFAIPHTKACIVIELNGKPIEVLGIDRVVFMPGDVIGAEDNFMAVVVKAS